MSIRKTHSMRLSVDGDQLTAIREAMSFSAALHEGNVSDLQSAFRGQYYDRREEETRDGDLESIGRHVSELCELVYGPESTRLPVENDEEKKMVKDIHQVLDNWYWPSFSNLERNSKEHNLPVIEGHISSLKGRLQDIKEELDRLGEGITDMEDMSEPLMDGAKRAAEVLGKCLRKKTTSTSAKTSE